MASKDDPDLLQDTESPSPSYSTPSNSISQPRSSSRFHNLVVKIADELDDTAKDKIRYFYELGHHRNSLTALNMLEILQEKGVFTESKTEPLEDLLKSCNRYDLIESCLKPYRAGVAQKRNSHLLVDSMSENVPSPCKKAKKIKMEEFDVSEIYEEHSNASVHCLIARVSPIRATKKTAKKYFTAEVTDGVETLTFVGNSPSLCSKMKKLQEKKVAVTIQDCSITQSTYYSTKGSFELHSNPRTKIFENRHKEFRIEDNAVYTHSTVLNTVADMEDTEEGQVVTVTGKIICVEEPSDVNRKIGSGKALRKQDCTLGDASMSIKLKIWEEEIQRVQQGSSYTFINVKVKKYQGETYLSTTKASEIKDVDDIGEVSTNLMESGYKQIQAVVSGVKSVLSYKKCTSSNCSAKVDCVSGTCKKCNNKVRLELCEEAICVKFTIQSLDRDKTSYDVTAFDSVVYQITGGDAILSDQSESDIKETILRAAPAVFVVNLINNIVVKVKREVSIA